MQRIDKFIMVNASTPAIFGFINQPMNLTKIWPGMIEVTDVRSLNNGGRSFQCVSRMVGARIQYIYECIEYGFNRCITSKISGGLDGWIKWLVEAENGNARVTFQMEYEIPRPLLKRHTETAVAQQNEHEAEVLLANLKVEMEKQNLS